MKTRTAGSWLVVMSLAAAPTAWARAQESGEADAAYYYVRLGDLALEGAPDLSARRVPSRQWGAWWGSGFDRPYAFLDGEGEALVNVPMHTVERWGPGNALSSSLAEAWLEARVPEARDLHGTIVVPTADGKGLERLRFTVPADQVSTDGSTFFAAQGLWLRDQIQLGRAGSAWFRHRLIENNPRFVRTEQVNWARGSRDENLLETYSLFAGGRAVAENLQLDRELRAGTAGTDLPTDTIQGITVPEFDWSARLTDDETATDPLAALVPADQHGLFFPTFDAFADVVEHASLYGGLLLTGFEARALNAHTRERLERQLALELDETTRRLGSLAIRSVAVTGSDPYLRTGSDVALLFETDGADALLAFLRGRLEQAALDEGLAVTSGEHGGLPWEAVLSPTRSVSSIVARLGEHVVVTNSFAQLERLGGVHAGAESLANLDEYRFFRQRYARDAGQESGLLILSDAAIRRWCGPRWRIGASRRTRAAAALAELTAEHLDALHAGVERGASRTLPARDPELGDLTLTAEGVHSSVYGSLAFQTPIAELDLDAVSAEEARLYGLWRDGYQRNWSDVFDPIALRLRVGPSPNDGVDLDLTVMPLIVRTEYRDLLEFTGEMALEAADGDAHEGSLFHVTLALDPHAPAMVKLSEQLGGMLAMFGADPLGWIGGSVALYLDDSELWDRLASDGSVDPLGELWAHVNEVPLAVTFEVSSAMRLTAFLATLRGLIDGSAPGMLDWGTRERDGQHYVELSAPDEEELSLFYGTTPKTWTLSTNEETLLAALARARARETGEDAEGLETLPAHLGASAVLAVDARGFELGERLFDGNLLSRLREASWNNLPILNEWHARFPGADPVAVHARLWHEELRCPGGGRYVWNAEWGTMESTVFGHPGEPGGASRALPAAWSSLARFASGLTFEQDGLRARIELRR